jgi:hypothetical protein
MLGSPYLALLLSLVVACQFGDNKVPPNGGVDADTGYDEQIHDCCYRLLPPLIRTCFHDRADEISPPGECRYLRCKGGRDNYLYCVPEEP